MNVLSSDCQKSMWNMAENGCNVSDRVIALKTIYGDLSFAPSQGKVLILFWLGLYAFPVLMRKISYFHSILTEKLKKSVNKLELAK